MLPGTTNGHQPLNLDAQIGVTQLGMNDQLNAVGNPIMQANLQSQAIQDMVLNNLCDEQQIPTQQSNFNNTIILPTLVQTVVEEQFLLDDIIIVEKPEIVQLVEVKKSVQKEKEFRLKLKPDRKIVIKLTTAGSPEKRQYKKKDKKENLNDRN